MSVCCSQLLCFVEFKVMSVWNSSPMNSSLIHESDPTFWVYRKSIRIFRHDSFFLTCRTKLLFESEKKSMYSKFFKERTTFGSFCLEEWSIVFLFFYFSNEVFLHENACHLYRSIHLDSIHALCVTYKRKNLIILGVYILTKWLGSNWINIAHDVNPTFDCMPHLFIQEAPLTHTHEQVHNPTCIYMIDVKT